MASKKMIQNCPITASDVINYHTIFCLNLAGTRGNTVQQNLYRVVMDYVDVPKDFRKLHKFVTLVEDVVFVNDVPFLITVSQCIKFVMVKHISTRTANQLSKY